MAFEEMNFIIDFLLCILTDSIVLLKSFFLISHILTGIIEKHMTLLSL